MAVEHCLATTLRVLSAICQFTSTIPVLFSVKFLITTSVLFIFRPSDGTHPCPGTDLAVAIFAFLLFLTGSVAIIRRMMPLAIICVTTLVITVVLFVVLYFAVVAKSITLSRLPESFEGKHGKTIPDIQRLEEYPRWFKNFVLNDKDWGAFQGYIIQEAFCEIDGEKSVEFQVGCCSPPVYCGYDQEKNKSWVVPKTGVHYQDNNCLMWSNDLSKLCYYCNTCKAAYLHHYLMEWIRRWMYMVITGMIWIYWFAFICGAARLKQGMQKVHPLP